uniref:Uncharacterized protein n=1 Tax=Glossina brevipalpis TaxID=37001 RepID=A0A1A9W2R2_9MUSC
MSADDDRLQKSEFAELIQHLTQQEILTVEYCAGGVWQKLITQKDAVKRLFQCNLCKVLQYSMKNLCAHLDGKRHKQQMKNVAHLYHPDYTHPKNKLEPASQKNDKAKDTGGDNAERATAESKEKKSITGIAPVQPTTPVINVKTPDVSTNASTSTNPIVGQAKTEVSTTDPTTKAGNVSNEAATTSQKSAKCIDLTAKPEPPLTTIGNKTKLEKCTNLVVRVQNLGKVENPNETAKKIQNNKQKIGQGVVNTPTAPAANLRNIGLAKVIVKQEKADDVVISRDANSKLVQKSTPMPLKTETDESPVVQKKSQVTVNTSVVASISSASTTLKTTALSEPNNNSTLKIIKVQSAGQGKNKQNISPKKPGTQSQTQVVINIAKENTPEEQQKNEKAQASLKTYKIPLTQKHGNAKTDLNPQQTNAKLGKINLKPAAPLTTKLKVAPTANEYAAKTGSGNSLKSIDLESNKDVVESEKADTVECGKQKDNVQTTKFIKKQTSVTKGRISVKSMASLVKNPFALKTQENHINDNDQIYLDDKDNSPNESLIIIDDEDVAPVTVPSRNARNHEDICKKSAEITSNANDNNVKETSSIIIDDEDIAPISTLPRTSNIDKNEEYKSKKSAEKKSRSKDEVVGETSKRQKMVLNPASAFVEKESESEKNNTKTDKPRYEINKVKSKHRLSSVQAQSSSFSSSIGQTQPNFTNKTFSTKEDEDEILGLLGVEYVIKIIKSRDDHSPRYECGLCELILDGFAMQRHLQAYNHRLKFCEKHFPTAIRHYKQYMVEVPQHEIFKVMTPVLAKLAVAIEKHHGRSLPYECFERDFNVNRHEILYKAFSCRHASENYGPSFTHILDSKEIDQIISERHFFKPMTASNSIPFDKKSCHADFRHNRERESQPIRDRHRHTQRSKIAVGARQHDVKGSGYQSQNSSLSSSLSGNRLYSSAIEREPLTPVDNETHRLMVEDFLKGTLKNSPDKHLSKRIQNRKRSHSPMHSYISGYNTPIKRLTLSPPRSVDTWREYRHLVDKKLSELNDSFKLYRDDPERHPSYNAEWQKFWKRRKDELIAAGLDHRKYNYQPEWVRFFKVRIEKLYSEEVENIKMKLRENLSLPMSNDQLTDTLYHVQTVEENSQELAATSALLNRGQSVNIKPNEDTSPQVVSVLRLMTALEEHLGSLGAKIIQLLSKALQMEKINPHNVNSIMLTEENWTLIETAKEKFKGLVLAGLYEGSKERALNKAIQEAERLFLYAEKLRPGTSIGNNQTNCNQVISAGSSFSTANTSSPTYVGDGFNTMQPSGSRAINLPLKETFLKSITNARPAEPSPPVNVSNEKNLPASSSSVLTQEDKKELASKLASSLVAQGKTDFDLQQLQQLIAVYSLMEKKKREAAASDNKKVNNPSNNDRKTLSETLADILKNSSPSNEVLLGQEENIRRQMADKSEQMPMQAVDKVPTNNRFNASQFGGGNINSNYQNISTNPTFPNSFSGGNYFGNTTTMMRSNMNTSTVTSGVSGYNNPNMMGYSSQNQQFAANLGQYNNRQYHGNNPNQFSAGIWNMGFQGNQYSRGGGPGNNNMSNWSRY